MHSETERELLWPSLSESEAESPEFQKNRPRCGPNWTSRIAITINVALIVVILWLIIVTKKISNSCERGSSLISSPANPYIKYETWQMNNILAEHNQFKGDPTTHKPTTEQTEAWRELLSWQDLIVSKQDLEDIGALSPTSSGFADGSGYLAILDVFHQLHCLNYIREYIYKDYYTTSENETMRATHIDHCLDTLRQITMCHADVTVIPFDWIPDYHYPYPNFTTTRECRNWDNMMEFVKSHQANLVPGSMIHPNLGPVPYGQH